MDKRLAPNMTGHPGEVGDQTSLRLRELEAVLLAIDEGELLSSLPAAPGAAARHQTAVSLLALLRRDLRELIDDMERFETRGLAH